MPLALPAQISRFRPFLLALITVLICGGAPLHCFAQEPIPPDTPLNQLQFIGSHNSYHIAPSAKIRGLIDTFAPGEGQALNYTRQSLRHQLEASKVRQLELDLYGDPLGGLYANPVSARLPGETPQTVDPAWKERGFKIFHSPDFDQNTTAITLRLALRELLNWSKDNPTHEPVMILLELKSESFSAIKPPAFDKDALLALEAEIREELPAQSILTPDEVRGEFATLRDAVTKRGWPALSKTRGKFIFALDNEDDVRDAYLNLSPGGGLRERLCFASVSPENPAAAWMKRNEAVNSFKDIQDLVHAGFMVRTRADSDLKEVRANDRTTLNAALASGAQWISTDAPEADPRYPDYEVSWPGHATMRIDPVKPINK